MVATDKLFAGSIPEIYDRFLVPLIFEPYAVDLAARVASLAPNDVLETAAGTGVLTRALGKQVAAAARIVATDLNQPMLDQAAKRQQAGVVEWKQADALALPFADASFDAWTRHYRPDENTPNACVSYYTKGALAALALDLRLRAITGGAKSLDDAMRALWREYGQTGRGVPEDGFEALASELAGENLSDFFDIVVRSTSELPLQRLLATLGIHLRYRAPGSGEDAGGPPDPRNPPLRTSLGARICDDKGRLVLSHVYDDGAAQKAGLSAQDELLAMDGIRITPQNLAELLNSHAPGDEVSISFFRREELMAVRATLLAPEETIAWLELDPSAAADAVQRRAAWLAGTPISAST